MGASADYRYIAYIDEAGDDGLKRVRPIDENGSSEWMTLSAVLIRVERESEIEDWVKDIHAGLWRHNKPDLHFAQLRPSKKLYVCEAMAGLSARYFVLASNKKNMRGYENPFAGQIPSKNWFYCWMTRLLLERVTHYVEWRSIKDYGSPQKLKIEFSERGGLSYSQMAAYYEWLRMKGPTKNLYLPWGNLRWPVMDNRLLKVYNHTERAGLQLADCVASAFFKAADKHSTNQCDPRFAQALRPRMAKEHDRPGSLIAGYGVKLMPGLGKAKLDADQAQIFRYYGYPRQWWDPDSFNKDGF